MNSIMNLIECKSEEEMSLMKEKVMKCKLVALRKMGKSPLFNPRYMKERDKQKLLTQIKLCLEKPFSEIDELFNEVVLEELLSEDKDVSAYPVYQPKMTTPVL